MAKTPNLGLNKYTFDDPADMRKITEDNDIVDNEVDSLKQGLEKKVDTTHLEDKNAHSELFGEKADKTYVDGELGEKADKDSVYAKSEIDEQAKKYVKKAPPDWIYPTLDKGTGSSTRPVRYRKEGNRVYIEGWVNDLEVFDVIFWLPEGFCPASAVSWAAIQSATGPENNPVARLEVATNGRVSFFAQDANRELSHGASIRTEFTVESQGA